MLIQAESGTVSYITSRAPQVVCHNKIPRLSMQLVRYFSLGIMAIKVGALPQYCYFLETLDQARRSGFIK